LYATILGEAEKSELYVKSIRDLQATIEMIPGFH
jgi:hypothetical protein